MPEVMVADGYRFWIHEYYESPPQVLVERSGTWCIVAIGDEDQAPEVIIEGDMRRTQAGRAAWIVYHSQEILLAHWRRLHAP
jgi:hypothetical protein